MITNRFEKQKPRLVYRNPNKVSPAWWCLAGGAALVFVFAITWLLTSGA